MDNFTQETEEEKTSKAKLIRNILIGILAIVLISGAIYFLYNRSKTPTDTGDSTLFPTGKDIVNIIKEIGTGNNNEEKEEVLSDQSRLVELYKGPVAGYTILESSRTARVFDRSKGLMFDINLNTGDIQAVTDQPILKVHDVTFIGQNIIITRSLDVGNVIKSNLYEFTRNGSGEMLSLVDKPAFLSDNILELSKSYNNRFVAFVIKDTKGSNIDLYEVDTKRIIRLISLPISEWIPSVTNDGFVFISSKASKYANSGTYKIVNGILDVVSPAKVAQTSLVSPDGGTTLSVSIFNNEFISSLNNTGGELAENDTNPFIATIADKCAWNSTGTKIFCGVPTKFGTKTPDEWYLGNIFYDDSVWQYDLKNKKNSLLIDGNDTIVQIDTIELNANGNILFFKNKQNEHLWGYRLSIDSDQDIIIEAKDEQVDNTEIQ